MFRRLLESSILRRQDTGSGGGGAVATKTFTRAEACSIIAEYYRQYHAGRFFPSVLGIESLNLGNLRATTTVGTNLEPAVAALNAAGGNVQPTIGGLMDAAHLTRVQIHAIACDCLHHGGVSGERMAQDFEIAGKA